MFQDQIVDSGVFDSLNITDIDKERAEAAMKRVQEKLKDNEVDLTRSRAAIDRARNRLKITSRI